MADLDSSARERAPRWRLHALAVLLTAITLAVRMSIGAWVGDRPILILFFVPIVVSAYLGGLGPGLTATLAVGLVTSYFVMPPVNEFGFATALDFGQWLFLLLEGGLISVLFQELQRWRTAGTRPGDHRVPATERKVRAGFAIALAFVGGIGIVSLLSVERLGATNSLVSRTHHVIADIDNLLDTATRAVAAQRGYVITGEETFVESYKEIANSINGQFAELRALLQGDAAQNARLDRIEETLTARLASTARTIQLRRNEGFPSAQTRIAAGEGNELQERLRREVQAMIAAEHALLGERESAARASSDATRAVIIGGSALALVFVGFALFAIRRDFAGRERAEAELSRFFHLSLDLLVVADGSDGRFKRVSPAVKDMLGYDVDEFLATPFMDLIHPDDHDATRVQIERQLVHHERVDRFDCRFKHKDGSWRLLSWRSSPQGNLMFAAARDITDVARTERELREAKELLERRVQERTAELERAHETLKLSERRFRALIENGSDSIALVNADNKIIYLSPAVTQVEGYRPEELVGRNGLEHTHPDDLPVLARVMEQLLTDPSKPVPALWRRKHKSGHWIWLEGIATNQLDDPSVGAIVANYRDVTDRIAQDERLREQLQRLALLARVTRATGERQDLRSIFQVVVRSLEDELPVDFCCMFLYDMAENLLTVNCVGAKSMAVAQTLGLLEKTQVPIDTNGLSRCVHGHLVYEPDIAGSEFPFPQRLASAGLRSLVFAPLVVESQVFGVLVTARRSANAFSSGECEFLRQMSEHTALAAHQVQLYSALQQAYDDLRTSQQQVMQQERLRALGQMASGIAHDINNAISPVALYTEALLEREPNLSERGRGQLEIIQRAVDDVAQTVARMGEFYRVREPQLTLVPVEINRLVHQVLDLTRARWADMAQQRGVVIEARTDLGAGLPAIAGVESQIRDALVNLVFNAVDAMPAGGPLTIRTRLADGSQGQIVLLEVIDTGIGMDEETRRRCLEPFFTTKGTRGTGLGLAMVYGVAQRHGAQLEIESEPGRGTLVRMAFAAAASPAINPRVASAVTVGVQRVLIIDDDPLLLKSLRDTLETDGHTVVAANGGQAGINAFVESHAAGAPYPVVITDLGMPHVDGRKVAATIKASVPETMVVMLTGWGRRLVAEGDVPPGVDIVLSKPPKLMELRAALAQILGKRHPPRS
jgi:PAS domain S-box-containing protein